MSKGDHSVAAQSAYSPLRIRLDAAGAPIGLVGPDGSEESAAAALRAVRIVTAAIDQDTGATVGLLLPDNRIDGVLLRSHVARKTSAFSRKGGLGAASISAVASSRCNKWEAEAPFCRVRFRLYSEGGAATDFKMVAAVTETAETTTAALLSHPTVGGTAYTALQSATGMPGWRSVTVGGVSNFDWTDATGAADLPKELVTDWCNLQSIPRADGGARPLVMSRIEHNGATNGGIGGHSISLWDSQASSMPWWRVDQTGTVSSGDAVTDLTRTFSALGTATLWVVPEFDYLTDAVTVYGAGDSNLESANSGSLGVHGSWGWQGCAAISSLTRPVTWVNAGKAGATSAIFTANALAEIPRILPNVVVYQCGTSNDSPFDGTDAAVWRYNLHAIITACRAAKADLIVYGTVPKHFDEQQDAMRLGLHAYCKQLETNGLLRYIDFEPLLSDGATPARMKASMTSDGGTHVNNAAEILMAEMLSGLLLSIIQY